MGDNSYAYNQYYRNQERKDKYLLLYGGNNMPEPTIAIKQIIEQFLMRLQLRMTALGKASLLSSGTHLVDLLPLAHDMHVLDIATGTGVVLLPAAHRIGPEESQMESLKACLEDEGI